MKRKLVCGLTAGLIFIFGLTGCGRNANTPPAGVGKAPALTGATAPAALRDIDLAAKGVQLTGYHQDLRLSPDGKTAAFSGYNYSKDNNIEHKLVLANLATGEVRTFNEATRVLEWLPEGSGLLYHFEGSLRIMDPYSGNYREIARDSWYGSLSPDGKKVAYTPRGKGLYVYDLASSQSKQYTKDKYDHHPVWYPDGKSIFYFADLGKQLGDGAGMLEGLAVLSVETGQAEPVTKEQGKFRRAEWIVPGKSLHILKGWDDGYYHGILDLEQQKYIDLGENLNGATYFAAADPHKGRLIVSSGGKVDIYDGHGTKTTSYTLPEAGMQNFNYAASPLGDKLAFVQGDYGRHMDSQIKGNKVKISDYDGQNIKELTTDYTYNDTLAWDKTGSWVIALQSDQEKINGIKVLQVK